VVYENPDMFDPVKRAWVLRMPANSSCGDMLNGGFGYGRAVDSCGKKPANKRNDFAVEYAARLQRVRIERRDTPRLIRSHDTESAFFYCDPPYVGANQGHYDGYIQEDFDAPLKLPESIRGTFLLSSYRNKALTDFTQRNARHTLGFGIPSTMACGMKVEVLTANYPIEGKLQTRGGKEPLNRE
jgi:DNA adenine methylase